ncbi:DNA-3-methyladenine glycosylase family protein [Dyadobacter subterraneus]|uniref:DNA-3-methyladenine glycosylase II n=1 Tax=Dyadobacter subterraneus TaxID=2773304 RepID=A0ABR9WG23_9BACT|nr:DNA-3-methyladenine glycosylase 2 family protein [Dyadobacter subterraneus]MBE9464453.1 DNA-3-methyladenine glycosylase 2 family protein [Dyadobacter subterraneus]
MHVTFSADNFHNICDELAARDEDLSAIIKEYKYPPMWTRPNTYVTLVHIILEQQVSLASALAALKKLQDKTTELTPENILKLSDEELKACYVSRQKTIYLRNLALELVEKRLDLVVLESMSDDEVRSKLTQLKGIGNWTTDIYLMFVLQRADIFPIGDLAAVNALKRAKKLDKSTSRESLLEVAESWKPYRTVATMILWHHYLSSPFRS